MADGIQVNFMPTNIGGYTIYGAGENIPSEPSWANGAGAITNPAAYGSIPSIPQPRSTATASTNEAIGLGQQVNAQLPGYGTSLGNIGANIGALTSGQVPPDVINLLKQQAAERGIGTGTAGSGANNASYLQALGLTSLGLEQTGLTDFSNVLKDLPGANLYQNPGLYVTPGLAQNAAAENAVYHSAPNPAAAAAANLAAAQRGVGAGGGNVGIAPTMMGGGGMPAMPGGLPPDQAYGTTQQDPVGAILAKYSNVGATDTTGGTGGTNWGDINPATGLYVSDPANAQPTNATYFSPDTTGGGDTSGYDPSYYDYTAG
jgi:hypothetical protein